jgi:hypothetical protein
MPSINYNDSRFAEVEKDKNAAIKQSNSTYDNLMSQSDKYYDNLIAQSKDAANKQTALQNQQTEFAIQKIEQQKQQTNKDYTKEQKGAYQDYMKQTNAYGSNMQTAGQQGLGGSGWSETIQAGFYNTYQNRYAQARENYNNIVMNYDNNIKEAQLQNSSALLQIYNQAQKEQLELALQNFTVIKDLSIAKQNQYMAIDSEYNNRWRQIESQINTENALAEEIRQYNASLAEQKRQADMDNAYRNSSLALEREKFNWQKAQASSGGGGGSSSRSSSGSSKSSSSSSKSGTTLTNGSKSSKSSNSSSSTSSSVKLSNGKKGYTDAVDAYISGGGTTPYSSSALISKGLVKSVNYNGKTYYYAS